MLWQNTSLGFTRKFQTGLLSLCFWERLKLQLDQLLNLGLVLWGFSMNDAILGLCTANTQWEATTGLCGRRALVRCGVPVLCVSYAVIVRQSGHMQHTFQNLE